ncbi:membrane protein [Virgibacillus soli]|nr:membrane protein [Virgibacillus soli]
MFFQDKKILIIGGTGTIGQGLLQKILQEEPRVVRVFSRDEQKQFIMRNQYAEDTRLRFLIGDVRSYDRVASAMEDVDFVFHTAAMKHVSFCEYNPFEAVLTNIIGTYNVIKAAIAQKVKKVIFTSTDKAISPTNNYGATKLTAEKLITSAEHSKGSSKTIFASVRFGNVMGSRGSVIPLFKKQILEKREMTVTDQSMSRFMMTLDQATSLTIEAMKLANGGETFILKMPVISLRDLVQVLKEEVANRHHIPQEEINLKEIGLRPGEKKYEELMTYDESLHAIELPDMFIIPSPFKPQPQYKNGKKAKPGNYQSGDPQPMSIEEIRTFILQENLI